MIITFSFPYLFFTVLIWSPSILSYSPFAHPHNTSCLLPLKFCITFVFHFSCGALIVLWAISGYHSLTLPFPLSPSAPLPPPQKKKSKQPLFLAGCQHLIRTLLLVIEVFWGEIKGNAHAKVLGSKQGVQMAIGVGIPNSACIF